MSKRSLQKIREFEREKAEKELEHSTMPEKLEYHLTGYIRLEPKSTKSAVNRTFDTDPSLRRL